MIGKILRNINRQGTLFKGSHFSLYLFLGTLPSQKSWRPIVLQRKPTGPNVQAPQKLIFSRKLFQVSRSTLIDALETSFCTDLNDSSTSMYDVLVRGERWVISTELNIFLDFLVRLPSWLCLNHAVSLPGLIAHTNMDQQSIQTLKDHIEAILRFNPAPFC